MSWIKLEFIEYDISSINAQVFFTSNSTKSISDFNSNEIINIPFLIDGHYDLYKVELELKKTLLSVFIYLNYIKLKTYIINNIMIPCRNALFEVLKKNRTSLKFNKNDFLHCQNILMKNKFSKLTLDNMLKQNIMVKCTDDNIIEYETMFMDLDNQTCSFNNNCKKKIIKLNNYIIIDLYMNSLNLIKDLLKESDSINLIVHNGDLNFEKISTDYLTINLKKTCIKDFLKTKLVFLNLKVLKHKAYFKKYTKFHSLNNLEKAHINYKNLIKNCDINNLCNNVELFKYDRVLFINVLTKKILKNSNFIFLNNTLNCNKKFYIENVPNSNFDYKYYTIIRETLFKNTNIIMDKRFNYYFLKNNIYFNLDTTFTHKKREINYDLKSIDLINKDIDLLGDIYIFEKILNPKDIKFKVEIDDMNYGECPITYENLGSDLKVIMECGHYCSFLGFINHLTYNSNCPMCHKELYSKPILVTGKSNIILDVFLGKIINNILLKNLSSINLIILENKETCIILNNRLKIINNLLKKNHINILFIDIENLVNWKENNSYNNMNIYIHINSKSSIFFKYKIYKILNNSTISNNIILNEIRLNEDTNNKLKYKII